METDEQSDGVLGYIESQEEFIYYVRQLVMENIALREEREEVARSIMNQFTPTRGRPPKCVTWAKEVLGE